MASLAVGKSYTSTREQEEGPRSQTQPRAQLLKLPRQHSPVLCPQDSPGDNECVMELEGREVVLEAQVACELPPDTQCRVTCQPHQVQIMSAWVATGWPPPLAGRTTLIPAQVLTP